MAKKKETHLFIMLNTRLPQSHAGGQGQYLRSLKHFDKSSEAKDSKKTKTGYVHWYFVPLVKSCKSVRRSGVPNVPKLVYVRLRW